MKSKLTTTTASADGLLLVDKPAGLSSHDVVAVARRALGEKRIGHGGTLDPFATGLLVLLLGRATRLLRFVPLEPKLYEATVRFGSETDTEDLTGTITAEAPRPRVSELIEAAQLLVGTIAQTPPAFSAKRVDGSRAYKLARRGQAPVLAPVSVRVYSLVCTPCEVADDGTVDRATLLVSCGSGTYIRSLARDLARSVGSVAHLEALRRTRLGPYKIDDAATMDDLAGGRARLRPAVDALEGYPRQLLSSDEVSRVSRGIDVAATVPGALAALTTALDGGEVLVSLGERRTGETGDRWQPRVVMRES
ncbi:MAG: tRNA pseudouridine(55) synthase TruB [Gemmatimonadetes bacterium]|nr:tRNA pseudouridine(55) synthase TruB [Gemmatimonadota bacterium]